MKRLTPRGQSWLKGFHACFACMWVGAAIVLSVKQFFVHPSDSGELYGIMSMMDFTALKPWKKRTKTGSKE